MRKLISYALAVILVLSCCTCVTADSTGLFRGINIIPELLERPDTDYVRRDEFSAVASALMGFTTVEPSVTPFTDVAEDNIYGSSIRTVKDGKIMNGVNSYEFAPGSTITFQDAIVTYIRILGYQVWADSKGGYPTGYNQVATSLKLFNEISRPLDSMLTFGDLWLLTDWVVEVPAAQSSFSLENGVLSEEIIVNKSAPTLLEKNLGLTMYEATVDEVIGETHSVEITITDDGKERDAKYTAGDSLTLKAAPTVNIAAFDKAPVYVWISDNNELVHIAIHDNCMIIYGSVYSVNRDTAEADYNADDIAEIALWDVDKDYEIHEDGAEFYHNDKEVNGSISLVNKYVRAVMKDGMIIAVETWDFKKGGIVSDINFKSIEYKRGDMTEAIVDVDSYSEQILIVDGEMRDIKELRLDTLVDYYISPNKDSFILLASEKKYTDVFESYADDEIQLGNTLVKLADTVFTNVDNNGYKEGDIAELVGTTVSAYVDAFGKVRYITSAEVAVKDNFIGYLIGTNEGKGLVTNKELYITNLDDSAFTKKVYTLSKNVVYKDDIDYSELVSNSNTLNAKSIYRFRINSKEEISEIKRLTPYSGYKLDDDGFVSLTRTAEFAGTGDPSYLAIDGKRIYFPQKYPMVALFEEDGEAVFGNITYSDLTGKVSTDGVKLYFFGPEMSSEFDLILISGDVATLRKSTSTSYGVVKSVRSAIDENGDKIKVVEIGSKTYRMSTKTADGLTENTFVSYSEITSGFGFEQIVIHDKIKLEGNMYDWADKSGSKMTTKMGTVSKIDSSRMFLDDGEIYFFLPAGCTYMKYDQNAESFEEGNAHDFLQGEDVIYIVNNSSQIIVAVFYMD